MDTADGRELVTDLLARQQSGVYVVDMPRYAWRIADRYTPTTAQMYTPGKGAEKTGWTLESQGHCADLQLSLHRPGLSGDTGASRRWSSTTAEPLPGANPDLSYGLAKRAVFDPAAHIGWDVEPAGLVSINWGTQWARSSASSWRRCPRSWYRKSRTF